jgi:hypothetical protein
MNLLILIVDIHLIFAFVSTKLSIFFARCAVVVYLVCFFRGFLLLVVLLVGDILIHGCFAAPQRPFFSYHCQTYGLFWDIFGIHLILVMT